MDNIKELQDGDRVHAPYLINNVSKGVTSQGRSYLNITLQDASGSMEAKKWDVDQGDLEIFIIGNVVMLEGEVIEYRDKLQMKVFSGSPLNMESIDITRFVPSAPEPKEEMVKELRGYLDSLKDGDLKTITKYLLNKYKDRYVTYPAATKNHHGFASGLLYHSISMARLAEKVSAQYPDLNRDFLLAGTLIHDLGKTIELSGPIATKYTTEGNLLGHISIMAAEIRVAAQELHIEGETPMLLEHMVLSHHGVPEYGSPVMPMTLEAIALSIIDDFDAKMNMASKILEGVPEGEWSERIFSLNNRMLYHPIYEDYK